MKKKLLFVIDSLNIGGAEKSIVSLLNLIDYSKYEIDFLLFKKDGDLRKYVPNQVNMLPIPEYFQYISNEKIPVNKSILYFYYRIKTTVHLRINEYKNHVLHSEQVVFRSLEKIIAPAQKKYDVAIAYSQGMPTYFVANKVYASKKMAWINTDYVHTLYDKELDYESYKKINKIITVSRNTQDSVSKIRKEYKDKVDLLFDIVDPDMINQMANEHEVNEFDQSFINIVTVGRLVTAKGYSTAIETARLLQQSGYKFKWFGIGEGPERKKLQELINKYKLSDCFMLLGKKLNPYPYIKNCDIYVQTSIKEGFGLTVSEAKILRKPIVCTNFPTAKEIINHNVDGLLVEKNINGIYKGIKKYLDDVKFRQQIIKKLNTTEPYSSIKQLREFYALIEK
ncbi:glycosyltransferase [Bacillus sp. FSL R10-2780]|uniref:glycosyltransferase n=1 Tax=Bacillus sp. FSL R10-2780 TaxID=2954660 RepID=UPI0030F6CC8A